MDKTNNPDQNGLDFNEMKKYSTFPRSPEMESHHQIQIRIIRSTHILKSRDYFRGYSDIF